MPFKPLSLIRLPYPSPPPDFFSGNRAVLLAAVVLFLAALLLRSWENILHPGLYMEDAAHYFNLYYGGERDFRFILQHPNGYYNIFNNLVAWLTSRTDVRLHALLYHLASLSTGILTATFLLFSGLIQSRVILLCLPLVLGLSGMNHIYYYVSLTFQMYNVVLLLLGLLFFSTLRSVPHLIGAALAATLLIWSGPYSVVAAPVSFSLLLLFRNGRKTYLLLWIIICTLLYTSSVGEGTIRLTNLLNPVIQEKIVSVVFERILLFELIDKPTLVHALPLLFLAASTLYALRKDGVFLRLAFILAALILASLAPLFLSIKFLQYQQVFPCHIYIAQFFWLFLILYTLDRLFITKNPHNAFQWGTVVILVSLVIWDTSMHPAKGEKPLMTSIPSFLRTVHQVEQLPLLRNNQYTVLQMENSISGPLFPKIRIGSPRPDAHPLGPDDLSLTEGKEFVLKRRKLYQQSAPRPPASPSPYAQPGSKDMQGKAGDGQ